MMNIFRVSFLILPLAIVSCSYFDPGGGKNESCDVQLKVILEEMTAAGTLDEEAKGGILARWAAASTGVKDTAAVKSKSAKIESMGELLGVYHSVEGCEFQMARWADTEGPRAQLSIQFISDYRVDFEADPEKGDYYCNFDYRSDYSNFQDDNHYQGTAQVLKMYPNSSGVTLRLKAIRCNQFYDMAPDEVTYYDVPSGEFDLRIQFLPGGKFRMGTMDAPEICYQAWNWMDMDFVVMPWSR